MITSRDVGHGYAVIDCETTGLETGYRHRIAEIAVIQVDPAGVITDEWSTLINPDRDLGGQSIHGIQARDVLHAPRFEAIAGDVIARLRGRIMVSHNWPFDARHLAAEFGRLGVHTPIDVTAGMCTMRAAGLAMPHTGRSLRDCLAAAALPERRWHTAHDDALAAAELLAYLMNRCPTATAPTPAQLAAVGGKWPVLPGGMVQPVRRTPVGRVEPHFLERLIERVPRDGEPEADSYLAMLDLCLRDRMISASEANALVDLAHDLGLRRAEVLTVHLAYLRDLAAAAWADGVVTEEERRDIEQVAVLLGVPPGAATAVLAEASARQADGTGGRTGRATVGGLVLCPGDRVVFTGEMTHERDDLVAMAEEAGLRVTSAVSGRTAVLVAGDPDSLSGKAKAARGKGIPIVHENAFLRAVNALSRPHSDAHTA